MQQFESGSYLLTLKNEKVHSYKFIALLLVIVNFAFLTFFLIAGIHFYEAAVSLPLAVLYVIYIFYQQKKSGSSFFVNEVIFFILAGCWVALQNYPVAFTCIILGILYHLSLQKIQFLFTASIIRKINFPGKNFLWQALNNVLMKDNILTMDFKNNTLIQLEIENNIDEIQFNDFATQQLIINKAY